MGNFAHREIHGRRASDVQLEKLFAELSIDIPGSHKKKDRVLDVVRFKAYLSGHDKQFGHDLCVRLFGRLDSPPKLDEFISTMKDVEEICQRDPREIVTFTFSILSNQSDCIPLEILPSLFKRCFQYAVMLGVGDEVNDDPSSSVASLTDSASQHVNKADGHLYIGQFSSWCLRHCPGLFDGTRHWILSCIHGDHGEHIHETHDTSHEPDWLPYYQLPVFSAPPNSALQIDNVILWMLSISLPTLYMGGHHKHGPMDKMVNYPTGGEWTLLYSSAANGFSINRFLHHCSDYHGPSVTLFRCHDKDGINSLFALAIDVEWRVGTFYWGNTHCELIEVTPLFSKLADGAKKLSLNEKERGFPMGLRVMSESDGGGDCILHVPSSFDSLQIRDGQSKVLTAVEVWGCGGMEVAVLQRKRKEWEKKEIARRHKVKREALEGWESNPDRYLLEWAGIATSSSKEQQQQ